MANNEPFDFARYFTAVQKTVIWHDMQLGMAAFGLAEPGKFVLDVGSGPGRLVADLRGRGVHAVGLDGSAEIAASSRAAFGQLPWILARVEQIPVASDQFDSVMAGNILFFLPDPLAALKEMLRVCRPGGWIVNWSPSEHMSKKAAELYASNQGQLDKFSKTHLVNWAQVAENNRRWSATDLSTLFSAAGLVEFATETTLGGLARYARGRKAD